MKPSTIIYLLSALLPVCPCAGCVMVTPPRNLAPCMSGPGRDYRYIILSETSHVIYNGDVVSSEVVFPHLVIREMVDRPMDCAWADRDSDGDVDLRDGGLMK